jgi:hypothetical protein
MKEKKCKVCSLFDERNFNDEIIFNINKLIKSKQPIEILNKETSFNLTDYYYKTHRITCLVNFEIPIEEQETKNQETHNILNNKITETLDNNLVVETFRKMSLQEQESNRLKLLKEAEYLNLYLIHHQLINGRIDNKFKGVVPKDDISAFKIINDIYQNIPDPENEKLFPFLDSPNDKAISKANIRLREKFEDEYNKLLQEERNSLNIENE